uniref:Phloem protein 2-12 n=1 Tax=Boehmeria nivea TaxID=83906 RepID=A0A2Z3F438_BOENI|nr:phloem protein 2-12 [Boehmeria nivea]
MAASKAHLESDIEYIERDPKTSPTTIKFWPRGLNIVWGKDSRYWRLPEINPQDKPKCGPAELIQVSWLEVTGSTPLDVGSKYKINFELSLKPDAFGWNGCQVYIMAKVGKKGKYKWKKISLKDPKPALYPADSTLEVETITEDEKKDPTLYFGLYEVWSGKWKGGLLIHHAVVTKSG